MIAEADLAQQTDEWRQARCGKVTASRIIDVITTTQKGSWGAARGKYMEQIIAERLTGRPQDMRQVKSLYDRIQLEPEARIAYSFYSGNEVDEVGFIQHPTIEMAGASPDGHVGEDGMIEIKCFDASTHVRLLSGDESVVLDYLPQMHFGMACNGREWCDFVSYSPHIQDEDLRVHIQRIKRDEDLIEKLGGLVVDFLTEVDERIAKLMDAVKAKGAAQ